MSSLKFQGVNFGDDEERLQDLMEAFQSSPLEHLSLDNCTEVPESFCAWFDPNQAIWDALKTLSLKEPYTTWGPGDDLWEEVDPEEREEWDQPDENDGCWKSRARI